MKIVMTFALMFLLISSLAVAQASSNITTSAAVDTENIVAKDIRAGLDTELRIASELKEKMALRKMTKAEAIRKILASGGGKINLEGKNITIRELSPERKEIIAGKINAKTGLNLTAEDIDNTTALRAFLSNGRYATIKYMPDRASARALEVLKAKCEARNCSVELKEVGSGNNTKLAYEVKTEKDSRVLLLFKNKMPVKAEVDAETGEIISVKKPWWAFMAKEKDENTSNIEAELSTEAESVSN